MALLNRFIMLFEHELKIRSFEELSRIVPCVGSSVIEHCKQPEPLSEAVTDRFNEWKLRSCLKWSTLTGMMILNREG